MEATAEIEMDQLRDEIKRLKEEKEKLKELRLGERRGRVAAEKRLRELVKKQQQGNVTKEDEDDDASTARTTTVDTIGIVHSCFPDRRGTPRQPLLCPSTRARIRFSKSVPPAALEGLEEFSHMWCIFLFHENTNAHLKKKKKKTFKAKIAPPQLGGRRVGVLGTRTPHRPNPIGLSVVKIVRVDRSKGEVHIAGADLVDGTPILDVKPYLPFDVVADHRVPDMYTDIARKKFKVRPVAFSKEADESLGRFCGRTEFYRNDPDALRRAVSECLSLDIRAVHRNRGEATGETIKYEFNLDRLNFRFETHEDKVVVTDVSFVKKKRKESPSSSS